MNCPNCNTPIKSEPSVCKVCGYRSELAREFFWLYLGGSVLALTGFAIGVCGVIVDEAGPDHCSRQLSSWYPLGLWPPAHHWMAFLVCGILITLGGMGITRRRRSAWALMTIVVAYQLFGCVAAATGILPHDGLLIWPLALAVFQALLLALLLRLGLALWRVPPRDAGRMQELALARAQEATGETQAKQSTEASDQNSCNSGDPG